MQSNFKFPSDVTSLPRGACADAVSPEASAATDHVGTEQRFITCRQNLPPATPAGPDPGVRWTPEAKSLQISAERDAWWHLIRGALAWIVGLIIEGFAAYGASLHPGFSSISAHTKSSAVK
jgi:hypothetical protein